MIRGIPTPIVLAAILAGVAWRALRGRDRPASTHNKGKAKAKAKAKAKKEAASVERANGKPSSGSAASRSTKRTPPSLTEKPRMAGGRRVGKVRHHSHRDQGGVPGSKSGKKPSKKEMRRQKRWERDQSKAEESAKKILTPGLQGHARPSDGDDGDEGKDGPETFTMGYTYTTTVTDARVQAAAAKSRATLARALPKKPDAKAQTTRKGG